MNGFLSEVMLKIIYDKCSVIGIGEMFLDFLEFCDIDKILFLNYMKMFMLLRKCIKTKKRLT